MRPLASTIVWSLLAGGIGVGLFFIKHEVKEQEARLGELNQEIERNQEALHVLKAEWSFLNDPARLRALSERYLSMKVLGPAQVATLDTLPRDTNAPMTASRPTSPAAPATAAIPHTNLAAVPTISADSVRTPKPRPENAKPPAPTAPASAVAAPHGDAYRPAPPRSDAYRPPAASVPQMQLPQSDQSRTTVIHSPSASGTSSSSGGPWR